MPLLLPLKVFSVNLACISLPLLLEIALEGWVCVCVCMCVCVCVCKMFRGWGGRDEDEHRNTGVKDF